MEIIDLALVFLFGFMMGELYLAFRLRKVLEDMMEDALEEEETVEVYKLKTESNADSILLYDDQNTFICQGKTIEELAVSADKYSGIKYAAVMHNNKIIMFMDGVVKETL